MKKIYLSSTLLSIFINLALLLIINLKDNSQTPSVILVNLNELKTLGTPDSSLFDFSLPMLGSTTNDGNTIPNFSQSKNEYQDFIAIDVPVGLSIQFRPPKGVNFDDLNSLDLVYYQFHKSLYTSYISSLIKSYFKLKKMNPNFLDSTTGSHRVDGLITFSSLGKNSSYNLITPNKNELSRLLEETLTNIKNIDKPPEMLINNSGIDIYYSILMND